MPAYPLIDAHVHLWDPRQLPVPWVAGDPTLDQCYSLAEYHSHTAGIAIEAMIYVQVDVAPPYALAEAHWVAQRAVEDPRLKAIVAFAPVDDGERVQSYLDTLTTISPLVRGVRRILQSEADAAICLQDDFVRGVQILGERSLSFDLCIVHHQLPAATELVRRCPNTQFMLDHIAKPAIAAGKHEPWRAQLAELAALPNVFCKVSGMVTEADHGMWNANDLAPYITQVLETFGEDRVAFGGDWPVVLLASSYRRWVETLDSLTTNLSAEAQRKLWAENARRFYRI